MKTFQIGQCRIDLLPVVNGLTAETDRVRAAYGNYESYGASMGIEGLEALRKRAEIGLDDIEVSELDIVYAEKMAAFGNVETPSPPFCALVDLCAADGKQVIALDFNDNDYTTAYIENVSTTEFVSEHRLAKKSHKQKFTARTPAELAQEWDMYVGTVAGYAKLNRAREEHIAAEIADTANYRKSLLAVVESERADGITALLEKYIHER
ncbi:MAG: hypothetical protein PHT00_03585 [Candidatus Methanomethylophilus sp.]|nr:hypothetical protein [Methanomethylophilus sp.]MDD3233235.1 hypothetical protein [Methanomethylophilus sp.]MDD4222376.1 hypothetical protein [Methanomethylophilus sp.]MDD4668663.1 hypothetical protein [Methanomethylophilus sp.]